MPEPQPLVAIERLSGPVSEICLSGEAPTCLSTASSFAMAIDASKFKAVNNRDNPGEGREATHEISAERCAHLSQLDTADRQEPSETVELKKTHLKEKLEKLR